MIILLLQYLYVLCFDGAFLVCLLIVLLFAVEWYASLFQSQKHFESPQFILWTNSIVNEKK